MPKSSTRTAVRQRTWRDCPDALHRTFNALPSPESLHPGPQTVIGAVCGSPEQRAIVDAYAFRFPVSLVEVID